MCVAVVLAPGTELSEEEIFKMGNANGDGFGLAWAEDGVVHWWKTLDYNVEYMHHVVKYLSDFPRFVHFRLSTVGGVTVNLCHPFEIGPMAAYKERGTAAKVMMHNGHWYRAGEIYDILKKEGALPDAGPWSDTRLAAFLASWDEDWLSTVTGRVATLDGEGNIKLLGDWTKLREGIQVSNKVWDHDYNYKRTGTGRRWEGWGWTEQNWKAKEEHEKQKAKEKEEEEEKKEKENDKKDKKEGKAEGKTGGKGAQGKTEGSVVVGRGDGRVPSGNHGGTGSTVYEAKEEGKKFDFTPWQNPSTGEWYQVDPGSIRGNTYRVRTLTENEARAIMVALTAAAGEAE